MKISRKNKYISPMSTTPLWFIPSMTYLIQKVTGVQHNQYEYMWWVVIPIMFVIWFMMNYKIEKR